MVLLRHLATMQKGLNREMTLVDEMGKLFPAIDVFAMSIEYLVNDMMLIVEQRVTAQLRPEEIHWVIAVPAIWSDPAKQLMKEVASKAGIKKEQLTIALEPEAASMYCRHVPVDTAVDADDVTIAQFPEGTKYMILDAGGGTIDITVHEVQDENTLREVVAANGGGWGGIMVDKAFEDFLKELAGKDVFEQFKVQETEDWLCLQREFEVKKREIRINSARRILMHLPASFVELCEKERKLCFTDIIALTRYAELVEIKRDKIKISKIVFFYLFGDPTEKTVMYVKRILNYNETKDIKAILMVGGFSESPLLQHAVKEAFPEEKVLIPSNPSSTVLRGALMFGHNPECITERILKYTYGVNTTMPFKAWRHPIEKKSGHGRWGPM
ncbi:heat shock 70 kDa protein 12A-like isoform X2 [Mercenaria mercenaria]|uniref:heat shock 70 kDa protein 12A-like isoform X2 n=1 Tax=Mercenaria mercenaria TaxID=6596 RepID=UPI00234E7376|nr:heat shock 70 kDa protein 12A-like isoform X2 [Mercenaria mercenaria]